jgi:hypothetical protein
MSGHSLSFEVLLSSLKEVVEDGPRIFINTESSGKIYRKRLKNRQKLDYLSTWVVSRDGSENKISSAELKPEKSRGMAIPTPHEFPGD